MSLNEKLSQIKRLLGLPERKRFNTPEDAEIYAMKKFLREAPPGSSLILNPHEDRSETLLDNEIGNHSTEA